MSQNAQLEPIIVKPDDGRTYPMGRMVAVFKADLEETNSALSVSEWWLEPNTEGPHIHKHPETHIFYIVEGCLAIYLQDKGWIDVNQGSYVFIPGDTEHSFENRSGKSAGFISFNTPGGFEKSLPDIVEYFKEYPLGDTKSAKQMDGTSPDIPGPI